MAQWSVYYDFPFCSEEDMRNGAPGREIPVNKEFIWEGETWKLLSIYCFDAGLAIHLCKKIDLDAIGAFQSKWRPVREKIQAHKIDEVSDEQINTMMAETPFRMDALLQIKADDQLLEYEGSSCEGWNPVQDFQDEADYSDIRQFLNHYSLDEENGWLLVHARARLPQGAQQSMKKIRITFEPEPVTMAGPHFTVSREGEEIEFIRPLTGQQHTLKVLSYGPAIFDDSALKNQLGEQWECPRHCFQLAYTITPKLPDELFFIADCSRGDSPCPKNNATDGALEILHTGSVMLLSECDQSAEIPIFSINSSLHFDPVETVEWRMEFRENVRQNFTLTLQAGRDFGIMIL